MGGASNLKLGGGNLGARARAQGARESLLVDKMSTLFNVHQKHVMYCEECNIDDNMTVSHTAVVCYAGTSKAENIHKSDLT